MEWISVNDRLPEEFYAGFSDWVLATSKMGSMVVSRYDYEGSYWITSMGRNITHWMPLPEPPKN